MQTPVQSPSSEPSAVQVRAQCERILAGTGFVRSARQRAFLSFIVNAALDGQADRLKEFTLGIEVFDKDENFDPAVDSIVRVEASRLRSKLREYYVEQGQGDAILINIPKGHYIPEFTFVTTPGVVQKVRSKRGLWLGFTVATVLIALTYTIYWMPQQESNKVLFEESLPNPASVAVLPLRDWSSSPEEHFGEAMTDALISSLARIRPLQITSFTSVRRYKQTDKSARDLGRDLGVAYIVDGSIKRNDERVQITAQLIDARSDTQIWSKTFDEPATDLAKMHHAVAADIAAQISGERKPISELNTHAVNPKAYEAYLKGRYFYNQFTAEGFQRGLNYYQEAIRIEPSYAAAYAGLASCHCLLAGHGLEMVSPVVAIPEAHSLAMKALSLNSKMAEPRAFLGIISFKFGWDSEAAERRFNEAIELNPSLFQAYIWHSQVLEALDRNEEAVLRARKAHQLNPLSLAANLNVGWQLYQAEKYLESRSEIEKLLAFNNNFWGAHWAMGKIHNKHKMFDKAISEFQLAVTLDGGHSLPMSALGYTYAVAGMTDEAHKVIAELVALSNKVYVSPFHVAIVYAGLNDPDEMFLWLEKAFEVRARSLAWMHVTDELLPFIDDPRYQDLIQRIGISSSTKSNI